MRLLAAFSLISLFLVCSCGAGSDNSVPVAVLDAPTCVLEGTRVLLDASRSHSGNGPITRYYFSVGHEEPEYVLNSPYFYYVFSDSLDGEKGYLPYSLGLRVQDAKGQNAALSEVKLLYVVRRLEHCPGGSPDVVTADTVDAVDQTPPQDVVEVAPDTFLPETVNVDTVQDLSVDTIDTVDIAAPDTFVDTIPELPAPVDTFAEIPSTCTADVTGTWKVDILNDGNKVFDIQMVLTQQDCQVSESNTLIEGYVDGANVAHLSSKYLELHLKNCSGPVGESSFALVCDGTWGANFVRQ